MSRYLHHGTATICHPHVTSKLIVADCLDVDPALANAAADRRFLLQMMFIKGAPNSHGFVSPRVIEDRWLEQFDWVYEHMDYAVFPITIHPDVSGKPHVLRMHERIINHINKHEGVRWCTFNEMAEDYRQRVPFKESK